MQNYYSKNFEFVDTNYYNYFAMDESKFIEEEFDFLESVKNSSLYQEMVSLAKKIDEDEELSSLAKKRDNFFLLADQEKDKEKKREYLLQFKEQDDLLRNSPLMKEYLEKYNALRQLLNHLQDGLTKEMKS